MTNKIKTALILALSVSFLFPNSSYADEWSKNIEAGETAYKAGENAEAEQDFNLALKEAESFGPNDVRLARTLNDLAVIYDEARKYDASEENYKRAIEIYVKSEKENAPALADAINNLANLYKDQKRYKYAEPLYKRAIDLYQEIYGANSNSQYLAMAFNNLACLYLAENKDEEAIPLFKRAIDIGDQALGPNNVHVMDMVGRLANAYDAVGKCAEAKPWYSRHLQCTEKAFGITDNDPNRIAALKAISARMAKESAQTGNAALLDKEIEYETSKGY